MATPCEPRNVTSGIFHVLNVISHMTNHYDCVDFDSTKNFSSRAVFSVFKNESGEGNVGVE